MAGPVEPLRREHFGDGRLEARRVDAQQPLGENARLDDVALTALVMNDDAPFGIENEVVDDAGKREVAGQLDAMIARGGARRKNLHDDDGIRNFDRVRRQARTAIDQRVRFEDRSVGDAHGRAVRQDLAGRAGADDRRAQRPKDFALGFSVRDAIRRHCHERPVMQFPTPFLSLGPDQEFVGGHFLFHGD